MSIQNKSLTFIVRHCIEETKYKEGIVVIFSTVQCIIYHVKKRPVKDSNFRMMVIMLEELSYCNIACIITYKYNRKGKEGWSVLPAPGASSLPPCPRTTGSLPAADSTSRQTEGELQGAQSFLCQFSPSLFPIVHPKALMTSKIPLWHTLAYMPGVADACYNTCLIFSTGFGFLSMIC